MNFHPVANCFPLMKEHELEKLAADIRQYGLREPIWLHRDGSILDGRNRYLACQKAGVEPATRTFEEDDDAIIPFVASLNLERRHMTTRQRAAIAAELANLEKGRPSKGEKPPNGGFIVSTAEAARQMNVGKRTVERAKAVKRSDPEQHERTKRGEGEVVRDNAKSRARDNLGLGDNSIGKPKKEGKKTERPKPVLVHDSDEETIVRLVHILHNLADVAQTITPDKALRNMTVNRANNLQMSLPKAGPFMASLYAEWTRMVATKNAAGDEPAASA